MSSNRGDVLKTPGYRSGEEHQPIEIMASMVGLVQKGVTLAPGAGVLDAGTVLGRVTDSSLYTVYANANEDGTETAKGVLRESVDTGTDAEADPEHLGNIVLAGTLKHSLLTGLDAAAITDLNGRVDTDRDYFIF